MRTKLSAALSSEEGTAAARPLFDEAVGKLEGLEPKLGLVFASVRQPLAPLLAALRALRPATTWIGASSAGEFAGVDERKGAAALVLVGGDLVVHAGMGRGLAASCEGAVSTAASALPPCPPGLHRTALMLLDPLAGRSEEATLVAGALLGPTVPLAGGAAGDDLQLARTYVGCNGEAASDAVVLAVVDTPEPMGLGVAHGHRALSKPLRVTSAEGATVRTIDGRPAWDVWADECKEAAGVDPRTLAPGEIGGFLLRFEAGLRTGADYKVRAPLGRGDDGSLSFACGMPEGTVFQIMRSEPEWQIASARLAAERARAQLGGRPASGALVFDCICRNLILGDRFSSAVKAISEELGDVPVGGFETYGEIALSVGDMSGFHNTTSVVLAFPTS